MTQTASHAVAGSETYQGYLKNVLLERAKKNPAFSMRALARMLGLQPSLLSEVLNGRRHLSEESAVMIAQRLGLDESERAYFCSLVQIGRCKNPEVKHVLAQQLRTAHPGRAGGAVELSVDRFISIADWVHFGVLKLLDIADFEFTPVAAAAALNVHVYEVENAVERLMRLELVERTSAGALARTQDNVLIKAPQMNEALRKYHRQMLEKTIVALTDVGPAERFTGTENVALDASQLAQAAEIFEQCFAKIAALSEKRKAGAEAYHLGIHMIPMSRIGRRSSPSVAKSSASVKSLPPSISKKRGNLK